MKRPGFNQVDPGFYRAQYDLGPMWRRGLAKLHYQALGRRRGWQPHALFEPGFFAQEAAAAGLPRPSSGREFADYLVSPIYWSVDPHPGAFFRHETFASEEPTHNPLAVAGETAAEATPLGYGHPFLDIGWWRDHSASAGTHQPKTLADILRVINVDVYRAHIGNREIALGPDPDVLFINGEELCPACTQYRVWAPARTLQQAGFNIAIINARDIPRFEGVRVRPRVVVVFRALGWPRLLAELARFRAEGSRIVFDCDDLIFGQSQAVGFMADRYGVRDTEGPNEHLRLMNKVLPFVDYATVPTEVLGEVVTDMGLEPRNVHVTPSFLSQAQVDAAEHPAGETQAHLRESAARFVTAAGSWTHHDDFASIIGPLAESLRESSATLQLLGALSPNEFPALEHLGDRVTYDPAILRDWSAYVHRFAPFAANLVPLALDNGFCHAKSEVKYLEAGLAGTMSIASPNEAYRRALGSGRGGWLVKSSSDWVQALRAVAADPDRAQAMGQAARRDVIERYGPDGHYARKYLEVVAALVSETPNRADHDQPRGRWSRRLGRDAMLYQERLLRLAAATGSDGLLVRREPRARDLWVSASGETMEVGQPETHRRRRFPSGASRPTAVWSEAALAHATQQPANDHLVVAGPDLCTLALEARGPGSASPALPWLDERLFGGRLVDPAASLGALALIVSDPFDVHQSIVETAQVWAEHAQATGRDVVILGIEAPQLGLGRLPGWPRGGSPLELATLLREASLAVRLDPVNWCEVLTGALLVGTPVATSNDPQWPGATRTEASTVDGWAAWVIEPPI